MALRIDFVGTLIWTIVLIVGIQILAYFLSGPAYCAGAIALFLLILVIANRRVITSYLRGGRRYY